MNDAVVVTGVGAVTPLGSTARSSWRALIDGKSAVSLGAGGYLDARPPSEFVGHERAYKMLLSAVGEAIGEARLPGEFPVCFVMGQSKPGAGIFEDFFSNVMGSVGARVASQFDFASKSVKNAVAACAGGIQSIFCAISAIESGSFDAAVVGAVEASIEPLYVGAFGNMGVLSRTSARPFDEGRDGFALGEGAAAVVIERKSRAMARGAEILSEISGISATSSSDVINIGRDSLAITRAIKAAAGNFIDEIDYINAHGTGTRENDPAEARAILDAFGGRAGAIGVSSTKAATGHMLGAGGLAEFIFSLLATAEDVAPPNLNLIRPLAPLDFIQGKSGRRMCVRRAMSLSYGFGSQIGAVVCAKPAL
ncbi:MAG: beta-ketoacyl synthase N-terminal-like domain-containing protein [Endomicrobiia bacterium]|nr:beta-ketoacyl synthase N-terminal-like domain-containing protein [Endomicrobiia bacterium]